MDHASPEINAALVRLNDAICSWERDTGISTVLVMRDTAEWAHRSLNGKPGVPATVSDADLMEHLHER